MKNSLKFKTVNGIYFMSTSYTFACFFTFGQESYWFNALIPLIIMVSRFSSFVLLALKLLSLQSIS